MEWVLFPLKVRFLSIGPECADGPEQTAGLPFEVVSLVGRVTVLAILDYLEGEEDSCNGDTFTDLVSFSNDLDVGWEQSFERTYPRLFRAFQDRGMQWSTEARHLAI